MAGDAQDREEKIQEWIRTRWKQHFCPVCHATDWRVSQPLAQVPELADSLFGTSKTYPLLPIFCGNCGYALFVNAITAGIVPPEEQPKPEPAVGEEEGEGQDEDKGEATAEA